MAKMDQIWANEGGIMVRFERASDACGAAGLSYVTISILDCSGREPTVLAEATLTDWRWKRAVAAMQPVEPDR
jgi:hypothetical protein